jgi:hypothetical protein
MSKKKKKRGTIDKERASKGQKGVSEQWRWNNQNSKLLITHVATHQPTGMDANSTQLSDPNPQKKTNDNTPCMFSSFPIQCSFF